MVFSPTEAIKLTVNNQVVHISMKKACLLQYFLDNPKAIKSRDDILDAVWGPGEPPYNAVQVAVSDLNKLLPADCKIVGIKGEGYVFNHHVVVTVLRFEKVEYLLAYSTSFKRFLGLFIVTLSIAVFATASYAFTKLYFEINPPLFYQLINSKAHFARDYVIATP